MNVPTEIELDPRWFFPLFAVLWCSMGAFLSFSGGWYALVDAEIQRFFEESGVEFPKGAFIKYDEKREALTIRNTPKNIERAEGIMTSTDGSKPRRL